MTPTDFEFQKTGDDHNELQIHATKINGFEFHLLTQPEGEWPTMLISKFL
jgi:hypothetical protein